MKIKKNILTAMIVGMTIGVTASSCEKVNIQNEVDDLHYSGENHGDTPIILDEDGPMPEDCPLCGLG